MNIALYNRSFIEEDIPILKQCIQLLQAKHANLHIYKDFYDRIVPHISLDKQPVFFTQNRDINNNVDFLISLGGDGTILDTVVLIGDKGIPVVGINLGRLGFLAAIRQDEIAQALDALFRKDYSIDQRSLVHLASNINLFGDSPFALNEFSIYRKDSSSMIKIHTFLNGEFLNTYWADGLIVATPTGSTGYSLSCNGPLVFPQASNFIITPVAPHNLNIRPVVVPDDTVISFEVEGRTPNFFCTLDSRSESFTNDVQLAIRKENFKFKLIRLNDQNFLNTIRKKLFWGIDSRN